MNVMQCEKLLQFLSFLFIDIRNKIHLVNHSKRGISNLVGTVLLISSVTIMGTATVSLSQSVVSSREHALGSQYANAEDKIKESLTMENFWYDTPHQKLNIALKNTAQIGTTVIETQVQGSNSQATSLTQFSILPGEDYTATIPFYWLGDPLDVYITTARGSIFRIHLTSPTDGVLIINKVSILGNGNFSFNGDLGKFNVTTLGYTPNAGLDSNGNLIMTGIIRDFNGSWFNNKIPQGAHPDFEKNCSGPGGCDYRLYPGIVLSNLGADHEPVYNNNTNYVMNHGFTPFYEWYHDTPGVNIKKNLSITLLKNNTVPVTWSYTNYTFFPIDNQLWNCCGYDQNGKPHNFSFTYEVHNSFTYLGGEIFNFVGDDDVWVFINHKLAIDLGGVHSAQTSNLTLNSTEAQLLGLTIGNSYDFDFFYAERHTTSSDMKITTSIQLQNNGVGNTAAFFVDPGTYKINELVPAGWHILNEQCTNGYTSVNSTEIIITVPKGTTTCTFTNTT